MSYAPIFAMKLRTYVHGVFSPAQLASHLCERNCVSIENHDTQLASQLGPGHAVAIAMNTLPLPKKVQVIASLCEGASIRSVERLTETHRDTVMRLGRDVGEGCARLHLLGQRNCLAWKEKTEYRFTASVQVIIAFSTKSEQNHIRSLSFETLTTERMCTGEAREVQGQEGTGPGDADAGQGV